ncbi:hydantoinase/oxoprolinase family protein [Marinomonas colpomeniae]|uniref:Hydantoinase/oxoprolinase family protein n=1 Tax=Marinomonas colpomeniae TaxID=2774408 RepID=A0ABR8P226_9GAMM|nr:hydantoinase/oxoprolinase family protein [Marinomonas colpomeniae]MBD5772332.1 hydantoinase/oxoprolinase family protein [Marinomonas colpomeniae]
MAQNNVRVGVDIGGTFTDVALDLSGALYTGKVLTNYLQPEQAILDGIHLVCKRAGIDVKEITTVIHGTTLVTNSLIERRGARTAFITTDGFRDVVEMRTENRFEQYDLNLSLPTPLVKRTDRYTLKERISAEGEVLTKIDQNELNALVKDIIAEGYEAVAVGFVHSYTNDIHEVQVQKAFEAAAPELCVSISSHVSPQMREFQRFNTVIANAYVRPQVSEYLGRLVTRLIEIGISCPVFMMHSAGGLISVDTASEFPVRLLESGPAGGAIFAAKFASSYGENQVVSFDMGGTTAKICLIEGGKPKTANTFEVARTYRFAKGSGMPLSTPVVEMVEIGAGGGSIAHVDDMRQIRVGPKSAGSEPGPACYQRGGEHPTVTDANLLLGRLDPDLFAGGEIKLSVPMAKEAMRQKVASKADLNEEQAAFGVTEVVDENMANAARVHTVENGKEISNFAMIAFGGGAPLHACRLCEKLDVDYLIIPPGAGVGSAIGFLNAPFSYEATKGMYQRLNNFDPERINQLLSELRAEALAFVERGAGEIETTTTVQAFMRYTGQGGEIGVDISYKDYVDADVDVFREKFETGYHKLFGRTIDGLGIEITNWSITVASKLEPSTPIALRRSGSQVDVTKTREFFDAALRKFVTASEIQRDSLSPGDAVSGPAVIVEDETSTVVTSGYTLVAQDDKSMLLVNKKTMEAV